MGLEHCMARQQTLHPSPMLQALETAIHLHPCITFSNTGPISGSFHHCCYSATLAWSTPQTYHMAVWMPHGQAASTGPCGLLQRAPSPHLYFSGQLPPTLFLEAACQEPCCTGKPTMETSGASAGPAGRSQGESNVLKVGLWPARTDSKGSMEQILTRSMLQPAFSQGRHL